MYSVLAKLLSTIYTYTKGAIRVLTKVLRLLTMYLVYLKVKARSQKVTIILKSQIGRATPVSWLAKEFDCRVPLGRVKLFSVGYSL